jgi:heat shock protein HslJ
MKSRAILGVAALPFVLVLAACGQQSEGPVFATPLPAVDGGSGQAAGQALPALVGNWKLVRLEKAGEPAVAVADPSLFTAEFSAEGRIAARLDCNRCGGGYSTSGSGLSLTPLACTRAYCGAASLDTDFAGLLGGATAWEVAGSTLTLTGPSGRLSMQH